MIGYSSGLMPGANNGLTYEVFEMRIAELYAALQPLSPSSNKPGYSLNASGARRIATDHYNTAAQILEGFTRRYKIQNPEVALRNPRVQGWRRPNNTSFSLLVDMLRNFVGDFRIGTSPNSATSYDDEDYLEVSGMASVKTKEEIEPDGPASVQDKEDTVVIPGRVYGSTKGQITLDGVQRDRLRVAILSIIRQYGVASLYTSKVREGEEHPAVGIPTINKWGPQENVPIEQIVSHR